MTLSNQVFKDAMSHFPSGVTVITAYTSENELVGMTASAFISVSLNPPLILESVAKNARIHDVLLQQDVYAVSILSAQQANVSNHFAGWSTEGFEPELCSLYGVPVIKNSMARLVCKIVNRIDAGDHTLFVGEVLSAEIDEKSEERVPLVYYNRDYYCPHSLPSSEPQRVPSSTQVQALSEEELSLPPSDSSDE